MGHVCNCKVKTHAHAGLPDNKPMPVKTIPPHFAPIYEATAKDVALIFGDEDDPSKRYFTIGSPLRYEHPRVYRFGKTYRTE